MNALRRASIAVTCLLAPGIGPAQAEQGVDGRTLYQLACQACHALGPATSMHIGPQLDGIAGKPAGTATDYPYSEAIKHSGLIWDRPTLVAWIAGAESVAPGTLMAHHNHLEPREVVRVVDYLLDNPIKP